MKKKLTSKQALALPFLAAGKNGVETAKATGIHNATISEWLNHDYFFVAELERFREAAANIAMTQLRSTLGDAVNEMRRLITEGESEAVRLRAAEFVITNIGLSRSLYQAPNTIDINPTNRIEMDLVLAGLGIKND